MLHTHFAGVDDRDGPESLEEIKGIELYISCSTTYVYYTHCKNMMVILTQNVVTSVACVVSPS